LQPERVPRVDPALERDLVGGGLVRCRPQRPRRALSDPFGGSRPSPGRPSTGRRTAAELVRRRAYVDPLDGRYRERSRRSTYGRQDLSVSVAVGARRGGFAVLALALAGAAALAYLQAGKVDERLSIEARRTAEHAAEAVASRLTADDLEHPIGEIRTETISSFVDRRLLDPSESVTIWSASG